MVLGNCDPEELCDITVKVGREAACPSLMPASRSVRADLVAKYGADPKDLDHVEKGMTKFGLTVVAKSDAAHCLRVTGPVGAMERAFAVKLSRVRHAERTSIVVEWARCTFRRRWMAWSPGVFGLDTRPMIKRSDPDMGRRPRRPPRVRGPGSFPRNSPMRTSSPPGTGPGRPSGSSNSAGRSWQTT